MADHTLTLVPGDVLTVTWPPGVTLTLQAHPGGEYLLERRDGGLLTPVVRARSTILLMAPRTPQEMRSPVEAHHDYTS